MVVRKQAGSIAGNDPDVGTGGTPFMRYLKKHRDENRAQLVAPRAEDAHPAIAAGCD